MITQPKLSGKPGQAPTPGPKEFEVTGHGGVTLDDYDLWAFEAFERSG